MNRCHLKDACAIHRFYCTTSILQHLTWSRNLVNHWVNNRNWSNHVNKNTATIKNITNWNFSNTTPWMNNELGQKSKEDVWRLQPQRTERSTPHSLIYATSSATQSDYVTYLITDAIQAGWYAIGHTECLLSSQNVF